MDNNFELPLSILRTSFIGVDDILDKLNYSDSEVIPGLTFDTSMKEENCFSHNYSYYCLVVDKRWPDQFQFLRLIPLCYIDSNTKERSYQWYSIDGQRIVENNYHPCNEGWDELVIGFLLYTMRLE